MRCRSCLRNDQPTQQDATTIIVFAGGIISGAALAAGQQPQEVRNAMAMFEESVAQPSEVGVPAQPKAVVAPVTQVNSAVQQPSAPQGSSVTAVAKPALARPQEAPVVAQPVAEVAKRPTPESSQSFLRQEDTSPLANAEPARVVGNKPLKHDGNCARRRHRDDGWRNLLPTVSVRNG